tara:strand:- start:1309 stop:1728 length:420 start_codon:yes stop_codon:yes gene_type:complete
MMIEPLMTLELTQEEEILQTQNYGEPQDEEEEPSWVKVAEKALAESNEDADQEKQMTTDWYIEQVNRLEQALKEARAWKPRPQYEVDEYNIALQKRRNRLLEDQNKLITILIGTLEENMNPDSYTTMRTHQAKKIVEFY